jgi:hypothetical protein
MQKITTLFFLLTTSILSQLKGQTSINISPTYNYFASNALGGFQGMGIETSIRFNSSKVFRYGFDIGYNQGTLTKPNAYIINPDSTIIPVIGFKSSYIPMQLIGEFKTNKHKAHFLAGLGAGVLLLDKEARVLSMFSGHIGLFYKVNSRIGFFTNAKLSYGSNDFMKNVLFGGFTGTLGINYQFKKNNE